MDKKRYITSLVLLIFFIIIMILVITCNITTFDDNIYNLLYSLRSSSMDLIMKTITQFGNTIPVIIITLVLMITLTSRKEVFLIGSNTILTVGSNQILKHIICRPRPNHLRLIVENGYSFPSGHSSSSFAVGYTMLRKGNKKIGIPAIILAILIALSRLYVAVHFPSDVVTGIIIGIIFSYVGEYSLKLIEKKNSSENKE